MDISFAKGGNWQEHLFTAYSFRFTETPVFTQLTDCITTAVNPEHREGFDNISLLSKERYTLGVTATLRCAFDGLGCPEIILVEDPEQCEDGAIRYGDCFEIVPWKNGMNIWRHYRENDGCCHWHLRLWLTFPVAENDIHELTVQVLDKQLHITLDGQKTILRTEDLPNRFHIGVTGCEGIARLYSLKITEGEGEYKRLKDLVPRKR
jgi:hypothetical protein